MADRNVVNTATLDTLRTTYNSTAADVGDIASVTGASGVIGAATDIIEAITLMNTEVTGIKDGTTTFASSIVFEGATADDFESTLTIVDPTADRTIKIPDQSGCLPVLAADSTTAITATPEELNYVDGVTSNIQTQLDAKTADGDNVNNLVANTSSDTEPASWKFLIVDCSNGAIKILDKTFVEVE